MRILKEVDYTRAFPIISMNDEHLMLKVGRTKINNTDYQISFEAKRFVPDCKYTWAEACQIVRHAIKYSLPIFQTEHDNFIHQRIQNEIARKSRRGVGNVIITMEDNSAYGYYDTRRSECDCICHRMEGVMHVMPCCSPDPQPIPVAMMYIRNNIKTDNPKVSDYWDSPIIIVKDYDYNYHVEISDDIEHYGFLL